jgi:DNA-binding MarR family transcriptional regulator
MSAITLNTRDEVARSIASGDIVFSHCTAYKSRQLARKVMTHFEASIADLGLKGTQFSLLSFTLRDGPISPSELALVMGLSSSTLSRNAKPLIAQGWLVMEEGKDGRSRMLATTPAGKKLCKQAGQRWQAAQRLLGEKVGVDELAILHLLLDKTLNNITTVA